MEYYSAIKKNEMLLFAGKWMELEIVMLNKINQTQDRHVEQDKPNSKSQIPRFCLNAESRPKMITVTILMGQ
jgi:hypothetical protein